MSSYKSITGKYHFYQENGQKTLIFDRKNPANISVISSCAALAFHKSVIGLCELSALETARCSSYSFRISRAVQTYYIAYHLFTAVMLLYDDYEIKMPASKLKKNVVLFEVYGKDLNSPKETAAQWDLSGGYEKDLAVAITHAQIKEFCEKIRTKKRNNDELPPFLEVLYSYFIEEMEDETKSIKCLYNKLCYIRDRAVYRPSFVVNAENGNDWQTSFHVRKEIDDLPSSTFLFEVIKELYLSIGAKDSTLNQRFFSSLWATSIPRNDFDFRSYTEEEKAVICHLSNNVDSYMCQMMELEDKARILECKEKYWNVLKKPVGVDMQAR